MTGRSRKSAINSYVVAVAVTGSAILLLLAVTGGARSLAHMPAVFWLLCLYMVVGEVRYIALPRSGGLASITTTTCVCLTLLLGWGLAPTALVVAGSSIASDLIRRKEPRKVIFNAGQYAIAVTAGGAALLALGARPPFDVAELPAFFVAAAIYLFVNKTLVGIVVAMHREMPVNLRLWRGSRVEILPEAILVALAPLVLVVAQRSLALAVLLPLPMIGVHIACRAAIEAEANHAAAEAAVAAARVVASEQARLAQAEQAVARRLQESERLKENLLATVSHELRTPLAGVLGAIATLDQRGHLLTPDLRGELIGMAARQGRRLRELIEDLLLAATLEQVPSERVPVPAVDVSTLARQACDEARRAEPSLALVATLDGPLPVRATPEAVLQVLTNLLDNAARHSPEDVPIRLEAKRQGTHAVIAVQDEGPGVPLAERERVFERFIRLDDRTSRRGGGVGLGLYVARRLARAQGGDLRIGEPVGADRGARFELLLPLAADPDPTAEPALDASRAPESDPPLEPLAASRPRATAPAPQASAESAIASAPAAVTTVEVARGPASAATREAAHDPAPADLPDGS
jgi:signal transduction histidine kinase